MNRRNFLSAAVVSGIAMRAADTDHPVPVKNPRATSGDAVEPEWKERLTITVGGQCYTHEATKKTD